MAYDDLSLRFSGASGATTALTTVSASGATILGAGQYIGAERLFIARMWVTGSCTTGNSLAVKFQDSATLATGYTDMGVAFSTWTMLTGNTTMAMGLQVHTTGSVIATDDPFYVAVRTQPGRPYVRIFATPQASNPTIGLIVVGTPVDDPAF